MVQRRIAAWLVLVFVAALLVGIWHRADVAAMGTTAQAGTHVDVYAGPVRQGINGRVACSFLDGIYQMRGELIDTQVIVTDPINREYYRSDPIPALNDYAVRTLTCTRSAQSGDLVMTLGGFTANSGTSQAITLATGYAIKQPISFEDYQRGVR